jgi:DNA helicase II / ATP-dependent DNA helicase PcrA
MADSTILDPAQQAAATGDASIQLTLAGPGSGKTTTLAARFAHLVSRGTDPRRILAVTFTKKAAGEMQARIGRLLGLDAANGLAVMTFHAFAYRHLRRNPGAARLRQDFQLLDPSHQRHVFHSRQMWWNEEIDILDIIDGMKERLIDAAGFARLVAEGKDDLPDCYPKALPFFTIYEQALREAGAIDFADMVPMLEGAMKRDETYRRLITGAFDHLLVDEFQDVNPGQMALISRFVEDGVRLWAVGDDDQTLFAFRASDTRHVLDFGRRFGAARIHILDRNYRSAAPIVTAATTLIRHNRRRADKTLQALLDTPGEIVIRGYSSPEAEARQVAAAIAQLLDRGYAPRQVAVLYRAGAIGLPMQTALKALNIPFEVRGSGDLWRSVTARLVVGSLHYLRDGNSVAAMSRLGSGRRSRNICDRLDEVRGMAAGDFRAACREVRRIVGKALPASAADRERIDWQTIVDAVTNLAASCSSLEDLERRMDEQSTSLRTPSPHAVVLSTVHSAKGLEWDAVFLIGCEDGVLPHANASDLEEERRVAYVAVTRAKSLLGLTYSALRSGSKSAPSPFLAEIKKAGQHVKSGPAAKDADQRLPLMTDRERQRLRAQPAATETARAVAEEDPGGQPPHRDGTKPRSLEERMARNQAEGLPRRHRLPWTPEEEDKLRQMFAALESLDGMGGALERKAGGILARLVQLGLLPPDNPGEALDAFRQSHGATHA